MSGYNKSQQYLSRPGAMLATGIRRGRKPRSVESIVIDRILHIGHNAISTGKLDRRQQLTSAANKRS